MNTRHTFTGNPATNAAARYSNALARYAAAVEIWRQNGAIGPRPVPPVAPPEVGAPIPTGEAAESETERARRIAREAKAKQAKLF